LVVLAIKKDLNEADVDRYVQYMSEVRQVPVVASEGFGWKGKSSLHVA